MNVQPVKIPINFVNEPRSTNKGVKTELQQPVNDKKSRPELQRPVNGVKSCPEFHVPQELIDQLEGITLDIVGLDIDDLADEENGISGQEMFDSASDEERQDYCRCFVCRYYCSS